MSEYTVDDLPRFSAWPARLLGLEIWESRLKTPAEVNREFDRDKWGALLQRYRRAESAATVDMVEAWGAENSGDVLCSLGEGFELLTSVEALRRHREEVAKVLQTQLPAEALIELGAGFGATVLRLAADPRFGDMAIYAAEYTSSGAELMKDLADAAGLKVQVGRCDLSAREITSMPLPPDSIIFTCMAAHYVPELKDEFVHGLLALRPKVVVHFEPCYEHCDTKSLTGAMRRRYIEMNDYNRNLGSLLQRHAAAGLIRIVAETPAVIGVNPLLPISVLAWTAR